MRFASFLSLTVTLGVGLGASAGAAHAADRHKTRVWIEARPWPCADFVAPLAQQIALACDAAGGTCGVASDAQAADERIVLKCQEAEGQWILEGESASGARLWSVGLFGDEDERLRRAGLWVARVDGGGPGIPASVPNVTVAAPASKTPTAPRAPAVDPKPENPDETPGATPDRRGGLSLSAHGAYETTSDGSPLVGARAIFGARIAGGTRGTLALDGVAPTQTNVRPFSLLRAGLGAAWGAPWMDDVLGAAVEVGAAAASSYRFGGTKGAPYGAVSLTAQYPNATLRPFVTASLSVFAMKDAGFESVGSLAPMVGLDVGLAWSAW